MSAPATRFGFVQLEFAWPLGPPDGRYLLRVGDAPEVPDAAEADASPRAIVVLATLGAPQRRALGSRTRRRTRRANPQPDPEPVATGRATIVEPSPLVGEAGVRAWLDGGRDELEGRVEDALDALNATIQAHRTAAADPFVHEVAREQALVARLGWGDGQQVAEGRWREARELPAPRARRQRRTAALRPQERLAALLGGRDDALACEELTLRARLDLDRGRTREAALQVRVALEAALAELPRAPQRAELGERIAQLGELRGAVGAAANAALAGALDADGREAVAHAVDRLEAALRARSAPGFH